MVGEYIYIHKKAANILIKLLLLCSCYTHLGKPAYGARTIYLDHSCGGTGKRARTPAHEVMHTLGRAHEQTRPDRDTYVTIDDSNSCKIQYNQIITFMCLQAKPKCLKTTIS